MSDNQKNKSTGSYEQKSLTPPKATRPNSGNGQSQNSGSSQNQGKNK